MIFLQSEYYMCCNQETQTYRFFPNIGSLMSNHPSIENGPFDLHNWCFTSMHVHFPSSRAYECIFKACLTLLWPGFKGIAQTLHKSLAILVLYQ
jgi:hypothetical protein